MIKIYGSGWVGKAMKELFPDALICDSKGFPKNTPKAEIAFICVPTPLQDAKLDTSIVEGVISTCLDDLIVVRSTVNPGDCQTWTEKYGKKIVFQPEYLGETPSHPLLDENLTNFIILGGLKEHTNKVVELYQTVYNANTKIRQVSLYEAEVIKLTENRAIAFKVMQCQELYDACQKSGIDYYTIRDAVYGDDPRFNLWFSFIYPDNRGFNSSKCLVKDVPAWCAWAESLGANADITKLLVSKSNEYATRT